MQVRGHQLQDKTSFNFILQGFSGLFTLEAKYVNCTQALLLGFEEAWFAHD